MEHSQHIESAAIPRRGDTPGKKLVVTEAFAQLGKNFEQALLRAQRAPPAVREIAELQAQNSVPSAVAAGRELLGPTTGASDSELALVTSTNALAALQQTPSRGRHGSGAQMQIQRVAEGLISGIQHLSRQQNELSLEHRRESAALRSDVGAVRGQVEELQVSHFPCRVPVSGAC